MGDENGCCAPPRPCAVGGQVGSPATQGGGARRTQTANHGGEFKGMAHTKTIALIAGGSACVALGVVGIFLPILPTTPFLLLAAVCYARSSKRLYDWLLTNRWFGEYIRNYREGRGMTRSHKTAVLLLLWLTIGSSAVFAVDLWWVRLLLFGIATGVTLHILKIRTFRPEDAPAPVPVGQPALQNETPSI